jgi:hypothetical protein
MHLAPRHPRAQRVAFALGFAVIAIPILIVLLSTGGSTATPSSVYAAYPALSATGPTELQLVASHASATASERPTWSLSAPEGAQSGWPLAESIRKLDLEAPNMTVWIAKSLGGGICVLLWAHQPAGAIPSIGSSCSGESEEDIQRGATTEVSEIPGEPGRVFVAGVVPSTVGSVAVTLASGSTETVSVKGNAWGLETEGSPQAYKTIAVGG